MFRKADEDLVPGWRPELGDVVKVRAGEWAGHSGCVTSVFQVGLVLKVKVILWGVDRDSEVTLDALLIEHVFRVG